VGTLTNLVGLNLLMAEMINWGLLPNEWVKMSALDSR
jgi:hypothetical protein